MFIVELKWEVENCYSAIARNQAENQEVFFFIFKEVDLIWTKYISIALAIDIYIFIVIFSNCQIGTKLTLQNNLEEEIPLYRPK